MGEQLFFWLLPGEWIRTAIIDRELAMYRHSSKHASYIHLLDGQATLTVKGAQLCLTLCDPMDYTVHGILQARVLEWVAFPFSRGSSQPRDRTQVSCIAGGFFTS